MILMYPNHSTAAVWCQAGGLGLGVNREGRHRKNGGQDHQTDVESGGLYAGEAD